MESLPSSTPAFGEADLSNCEREQIHLAGSIQPHGALLVVSEPGYVVVQASENAAEFLNLDGQVIGRSLEEFKGDLYQQVGPSLDDPLHRIPTAVRCQVGEPTADFDGLLHRPPDGGLIIELERAGPAVDLSQHVQKALQSIPECSSLRALCEETAKVFKDLTGYDRVMVYRFDEEGHGEILSERREPELESFLGNRYPASDIPQIARRLYERNRVRVLVDVEYAPVPITPRLSPLTRQDLDMSLCFLRSMSPIHIQYLKNMGVGATLVVSLVAAGKLWGLVACHHYSPRFVHYEMRAVCELLAETIATRIAALESFVQAEAELTVRRLEQRMIEAISRAGDWRQALFDSSQSLLQPLKASGAALLFENQILTAGEVPGTVQLRQLGSWLDDAPRASVHATRSLGLDEPEFAPLTPVASGLLATPISASPGEYLIWFRPERVRTVTWGGNPHKPMEIGDDPSDLSPRRSFAQWHEVVKGTAETWTPADMATARMIGHTVADVVLQFRSVRMLIAQDQLKQVSGQVGKSDQPVIIADPRGRILLTNEAFEQLLQSAPPHVERIEDLASLFAEPSEVRDTLKELVDHHRVWRGEVRLKTSARETRTLVLRADPVFSAPERVLGFVLLFTDVTERKAVEIARGRFQQAIIEQQRAMALQLEPSDNPVYRKLLASIMGNAQLAALEITDGVELAQVPDLLEGVQTSAIRTAELLEHLMLHASRAAKYEP